MKIIYPKPFILKYFRRERIYKQSKPNGWLSANRDYVIGYRQAISDIKKLNK